MRILMVFNFLPIEIFFGTFFIWMALLSFFLWRALAHYNKLTSKTGATNLKDALEKMLDGQNMSEKRIDELTAHLNKIEKEGLLHVQKMGLVRFNPFKDTGGDQSFVLALLDSHDNGVVISSLHGRSGTRWYAKTIVNGRGREHELSEEEERAISEACKRSS